MSIHGVEREQPGIAAWHRADLGKDGLVMSPAALAMATEPMEVSLSRAG